jgi:serpin B
MAAFGSGTWAAPAPADGTQAQFASESINAIGVELLRRQSASSEGNALLSPYSIQTALAMTWAGADGETREEMARVLHYPADEKALHLSMAALRQALEDAAQKTVKMAERTRQSGGKGDPLTLSVANRLFGQSGYAFRDPFLDLTADCYKAPFEALDFKADPEDARRHINEWVEEQTRERIRDLIPPNGVESDTGLVLVNAIHLMAPWADPFQESATSPAIFHVNGGRGEEVPTMRRQGRLGFAERDGYSAITIPYIGGEVQFLVLLPDQVDGLNELEQRLTSEILKDCAQPAPTEVDLFLPRFKIEPPLLRLGAELRALGMNTAFDEPRGSANFDRMAPRRPNDYLKISEVFHKTFLALDEDGTEAAAATAVSMLRVTSMPGPRAEPREVRVDRPFLFAIQHRASGACLFLGRVTDPR